MKLAWNPRHGIPVGQESLPVAEEGPGNYRRDKCKGPRLGGKGALQRAFEIRRKQTGNRPFTRDAPTSRLVGMRKEEREETIYTDLITFQSSPGQIQSHSHYRHLPLHMIMRK
jgi:hypothetical protein